MLAEHDVPDDEIDKMTYENAMRWYSFDPFAHIPKEQATVGALPQGRRPRRLDPGAIIRTQEGLEPRGQHTAGTAGQVEHPALNLRDLVVN